MIGDFKAQIVHFSHSFFLKDLNFDHGQFCATFVIALLIDKLTENICQVCLSISLLFCYHDNGMLVRKYCLQGIASLWRYMAQIFYYLIIMPSNGSLRTNGVEFIAMYRYYAINLMFIIQDVMAALIFSAEKWPVKY